MTITQITPAETHALLRRGYRYVDVRTEPEFAGGHPVGAVNIPVVLPDPATGQMRANPEFVSVVTAHFPKEGPVVLGCLSGARSQRAAEILAEAGYAELYNVQGGFGGAHDAMGRTLTPGWVESGLPVCTTCDEANTYAGLRGGK